MDLKFDLLPQLFVNGVINGSAYAALGLSFALILRVAGRFHVAWAMIYTLAAYVAVVAAQDFGLPLVPAIILGLAAAALAGILTEWIVYRPLDARGGGLLGIFIASLGLIIVTENLIRLTWASQTLYRPLPGFPTELISLQDVTFTTLDLASVLTAWFLLVAVALFLKYAPHGRWINAVRVNPEMAQVVGISPDKVHLLVFVLGSVIAGVFAIYAAMKFAAVPDMGWQPLFLAFMVAFLSPRFTPLSLALTGIFVGLVESLSGIALTANWSPLVVFSVLLAYLIVLPIRLPRLAKLVRAWAG